MSILLDTNVVSEVMRSDPNAGVLAWLDSIDPGHVHLSALTVAEVRVGLALLPEGLRRSGLERAFDQFLRRGFGGRVLPFDELCAGHYADLIARRTTAGRSIATIDAQIASIAIINGLTVATRNVSDFDDVGVRIIDPFQV